MISWLNAPSGAWVFHTGPDASWLGSFHGHRHPWCSLVTNRYGWPVGWLGCSQVGGYPKGSQRDQRVQHWEAFSGFLVSSWPFDQGWFQSPAGATASRTWLRRQPRWEVETSCSGAVVLFNKWDSNGLDVYGSSQRGERCCQHVKTSWYHLQFWSVLFSVQGLQLLLCHQRIAQSHRFSRVARRCLKTREPQVVSSCTALKTEDPCLLMPLHSQNLYFCVPQYF